MFQYQIQVKVDLQDDRSETCFFSFLPSEETLK